MKLLRVTDKQEETMFINIDKIKYIYIGKEKVPGNYDTIIVFDDNTRLTIGDTMIDLTNEIEKLNKT